MNSKNFLKTVKKKVYDLIGLISLKDKPKDKKAIDHNKKVFFIYLIGLPVVFSLILNIMEIIFCIQHQVDTIYEQARCSNSCSFEFLAVTIFFFCMYMRNVQRQQNIYIYSIWIYHTCSATDLRVK